MKQFNTHQEIIVILLVIFSSVFMDLSDPSWNIKDKIAIHIKLASYNWCTILTLFKRLLRLIFPRCFSNLFFVFLVWSSLMDLQCWWTAANSKLIEFVSWRGMLWVEITARKSGCRPNVINSVIAALCGFELFSRIWEKSRESQI